jgi:hypothetical protein
MFEQLAIMVGQAAIVPSEHDAGGAGDGRSIVRNPQIGQQICRHSDVVCMTEIILQRFEALYEFRNLGVLEKVFEKLDHVTQRLDLDADLVAPL